MNFFYKIRKRLRYLIQFFRYFLFSKHWRGFGIHSPFIYDFHRNILRYKGNDTNLMRIKKTRNSLKKSGRYLFTRDFGTGGDTGAKHHWISVRKATKEMSISHKYGKILYSLVRYFPVTNVLEIGTGIGVSTLYMAMANPSATILSVEGSPQKAQFASELFRRFGLKQIKVWTGEFNDVLPSVLKSNDRQLDLVFIDGNHREHSTIKYFEMIMPYLHNDSLIVFDDIHWSKGMSDAWETIKKHDRVKVTIDLFRLGIVFVKNELSKQNFMIRY